MILTVERVSVRYGPVTAVDRVSFSVAAGERVALTGPNGAGKTSLLDCVSGVVAPARGRVLLADRDLAGVGPAARAGLGVARTLQGLGVVDSLDVAANLLLGRHARMRRSGLVRAAVGWPPARAEEAAHRARCAEVAAALELELELDRCTPAGALPAGARKRLQLGRALAMDPVLLLLDEPFAGAAPDEVDLMAAAIRRCAAAAVIVDHHLDAVLGLCDRAVALEAGVSVQK